MLHTTVQDVKYALRLLRRSPLFTLTAALSLAIGIGANTTIFSVASTLLLRPLPGLEDPSRLVDVGRTQNGRGFDNLSYPNYRDYLERQKSLIDVYAGLMASEVAAERMDRLKKAGLDNITFAWAGETAKGKKHYYRVQGPTFLIEYDNTQNDGNHIHAVWRDFQGDFGRDLLREHLRGDHAR